ncbi:TPA: hypothetical protein ACNV2W_003341 [Citrobacter freundii]
MKTITVRLQTNKAFRYFENLLELYEGWGNIHSDDDIYLQLLSPDRSLKTPVKRSWLKDYGHQMGLLVSDLS